MMKLQDYLQPDDSDDLRAKLKAALEHVEEGIAQRFIDETCGPMVMTTKAAHLRQLAAHISPKVSDKGP